MEQKTFTDQRTSDRIELQQPVRYLTSDQEVSGAVMRDISVSGAAICSPMRPCLNEKVIAYVGDRIRLEGHVVRFFKGGFAISLNMSAQQLARLLKQLPQLGSADTVSQHPAVMQTSVVSTANGTALPSRISELSLVGAAIESKHRPAIGETVYVRKKAAVVVGHTSSGFTVEFSDYWSNLPGWGYNGYYARSA